MVFKKRFTESEGELNSSENPVKLRERTPRKVMQSVGAPAVDDCQHTRFVRNTPKRIRKHEQMGYRIAKPEDVGEGHDGYLRDGGICDGDSILMICDRERVEARATKRFLDEASLDRRKQEKENAEGQLVTDEDHHYKRKGSRTYFIP